MNLFPRLFCALHRIPPSTKQKLLINLQCNQLFHQSARYNMPSALVFLAEGVEEMEVVITVDVLRRGGIDVTVAGLNGMEPVVCAKNVKLVPDKTLADAVKAGPYDLLFCPGGAKGAQLMSQSPVVGKALKEQESAGRFLSAVCAGPTVFIAHQVAKGKKLTAHPGVKDQFKGDYTYNDKTVMVDGKFITSQGPGTCFEMALAIVEQLMGKDKAKALLEPMVLKI